MKNIIELNEKDVIEIISKYYNVPVENINAYYPYETRGYGVNAMEVPTVEIRVEKHDKII